MGLIQTCDVTKAPYAHSHADSERCLRPMYFFHSKTAWRFEEGREAESRVEGRVQIYFNLNGSFEIFTVMTYNVLNCLESPVLL